MSDINLRISKGVASATLSLSAGDVTAGDLMLAYVASGGSVLPTEGTGWTGLGDLKSNSNAFQGRWFMRVANATDAAGTSYTFTTGTGPGILFSAWYSASGQTIRVGPRALAAQDSAATSATLPALTTIATNSVVVTVGWQGSSNTVTVPGGETALTSSMSNAKHAYYPQAAQGACPTDTYTATGSAAVWQLSQLALSTHTADIQLRTAKGANSATLTLAAGEVAVGDFMLAFVASGGAITGPAGWTVIGSDSTNFPAKWFYRIANSTDAAGTSYTWTTGASPGLLFSAWYSATAATLSLGPSSVSSTGSGNSTVMPAITTTQNACVLATVAWQGNPSNSVDVPTPESALNTDISNAKHGWYFQAAAGAAATDTFPMAVGTNAAWEIGQLAIQTSAAPPIGAVSPPVPIVLVLQPPPFSQIAARFASVNTLGGAPPVVPTLGTPTAPLVLPQPPPFSQIASRFASVNATTGNPGNLRETQVTSEVVVQGPANLRETQVTSEVVVQDSTILRVTQDTVDATLRISEHYRLTQITIDVLIRESPIPPPPPIPVPVITNNQAQGPRKATLYSLDRRVFEPIQEFPDVVRAAAIIAVTSGTRWSDLTQPWATYLAAWESFADRNELDVFLGLDDGTQTTWAELVNPWSTYPQSWNSFPAGGNVDVFSDNSTTDAGKAIAFSLVPALVQADSRQDILLDSWDFILKIASFFELLTVEFDALRQPLSAPVPITAAPIALNDKSTFSIGKAYPGQSRYSRYIQVSMSGVSFTRAFAFGGAIIFVQIQERPSK